MTRRVCAALAGLAVAPFAVPAATADPEPALADVVKALPADRDFPSSWKIDRGQAGWTMYTGTAGSDPHDGPDPAAARVEVEPEGCDPGRVMTDLKEAATLAFVKATSPEGGPLAGKGDEVKVRVVLPSDAEGLFGSFAGFAARCPQFRLAQSAAEDGGTSADGSFADAPAPPGTAGKALALMFRMRQANHDGSVESAVAEEQVALVRGVLVVSYGFHAGSSEDGAAAVALSRELFAETARRLHDAR